MGGGAAGRHLRRRGYPHLPGDLLGRHPQARPAGRGRRRHEAAAADRRRPRRRGRRRVRRAWTRTAGWAGRAGRRSGRGASWGAGRSADMEGQPRTPLRITDRDRLTVADVDGRHPIAIDENAVGAPVDGHPLVTGIPQHTLLDAASATGWPGRPVGCPTLGRSPPSRRGPGAKTYRIDPTRTVNGKANDSGPMTAIFPHVRQTESSFCSQCRCGVPRQRNSPAACATPRPRRRAPGGLPNRARPVAVRSPRRGRPEPR